MFGKAKALRKLIALKEVQIAEYEAWVLNFEEGVLHYIEKSTADLFSDYLWHKGKLAACKTEHRLLLEQLKRVEK